MGGRLGVGGLGVAGAGWDDQTSNPMVLNGPGKRVRALVQTQSPPAVLMLLSKCCAADVLTKQPKRETPDLLFSSPTSLF
jgi:hypothetical protein